MAISDLISLRFSILQNITSCSATLRLYYVPDFTIHSLHTTPNPTLNCIALLVCPRFLDIPVGIAGCHLRLAMSMTYNGCDQNHRSPGLLLPWAKKNTKMTPFGQKWLRSAAQRSIKVRRCGASLGVFLGLPQKQCI